MTRMMIAGLAAVLVLAACGEKNGESPRQAMPGMSNMQGMVGRTMRADSLMPMMHAHLDDAMGADMMGMGMTGDSAWTALTDSVRRDLAELPSLSGRALETRMRAHIDRMRRLMGMHETMMRTMMKPE